METIHYRLELTGDGKNTTAGIFGETHPTVELCTGIEMITDNGVVASSKRIAQIANSLVKELSEFSFGYIRVADGCTELARCIYAIHKNADGLWEFYQTGDNGAKARINAAEGKRFKTIGDCVARAMQLHTPEIEKLDKAIEHERKLAKLQSKLTALRNE